MKQLLVFLKLSVVLVIILPLALNDYNGTLRAHQQAQTGGTMTQNVNVDNKYLTSNLLDTAKEPLENIDSFYNSLPKTSIENDNYSINKEKGRVGVPQVRLAGGLFFDYGGFNATTKKRIGDGMFGDANATSLNDTIPVQDTMPADDQMASRSAPLTNKEDDLSNFAFQGNRRNGTFNWNMAHGQANSSEEDQIVNKSDFNLTPNKVRYVKNKKVQTTASPEKKLFRDIINKELFDWYWTTWAKEYDERTTAEYNLNNAQRWQKDLIESKLDQSIRLDLSLAWNQIVNENLNSAYDTWLNIVYGLGLDMASDMTLQSIPWLWGWTSGEVVSLLFPGPYTQKVEKNNMKNYFSPALNQTFWYNLFNQYLGTPTSKSGLINSYYQKYKVLPENVHLNNFDFYMPFQNMNIGSTMKHTTRFDPKGNAWGYTSTTDFSKFNSNFNLQLGMNFSLSRNTTDTDNLMNELKKMQPLLDFYYNIHPPYTAKNNLAEIRSLIKGYDDKLGAITPDLTFQGNIKKGMTNDLEVYYKGIDQNFAIPLKTM